MEGSAPITDLDPAWEYSNADGRKTIKGCPSADATMTTNPTLAKWHPGTSDMAALQSLPGPDKVAVGVGSIPGHVRVAYQVPAQAGGVCGSSFEDALALENVAFFKSATAEGTFGRVREVIEAHDEAAELANSLHTILHGRFDKGEFASDLLEAAFVTDEAKRAADEVGEPPPPLLQCPRYIEEALRWLDGVLRPVAAGGTP